MPSIYPDGGTDSFSAPISPSTTTLSSAGSSTRNHTESHQDLGDAIENIQNNVTQLTHSHDGTGLNGLPLRQSNTHQVPDTDSGSTALHHTIGTGAFQSAAGNHNHDTKYVDFATNQTINGIKTLNAPAISTFINAQHRHQSAVTGGIVPGGFVSSYGAEASHPSTLGSSTTTDFYLTAPFTIPANIALDGQLTAQFIWSNGQPATSTITGDTYMYACYTNAPYSPGYSGTYNIIPGVGDHTRMIEIGIHTGDTYRQLILPLYIGPQSTARTSRIVVRAVNGQALVRNINFSASLNAVVPLV